MSKITKQLSLPAGALVACLLVTGCGGDASAPASTPPVVIADTTPPTVAITDSEPGATATGPVTFTFTFSESIGTSFTADDIVVTGGTAGTFTLVSGTVATLVVTPPAAGNGTLGVSVAAGKFTDLAANANVVAASATQAFATAPVVAMSLPVTFDSATVGYGFIGFGGAEDSTIAADPANAANKVAKVVRAAGSETYAGTTITAAAGLGFTPKIPFDANDTTMSVRVWSPDAGIPVRLKVEDHADNTKSVETEAMTTVANGWQTLVFNFANQAAGTAAIDYRFNYDKATIFFDFGRSKATSVQKTYYFDDITFVPGTVPPPPPPPPPSGAVITFDEAIAPVLTGFGGAENASVVADPSNAANKVAKVVKSSTAELWAGTTVSNRANNAIAAIDFSGSKTMTVRVWSPDAGIPVRLKVEDAADNTRTCETEATTTVAAGWQTLTFNFASPAAGTAALNPAFTYNKASIFFNFGKTGAQVGSDKTYYFDDVNYTPVSGSGTGGGTGGATTTIATLDEATAVLTGFEGAADSTIVTDPTGGANKVGKVVKPATGAAFYAGTTISTGANLSVPTIPFTASSAKVTVRVYSPAVGVRVRLKVEKAGDPSINVETDAFTTTSGAWETLTFDFADPRTHFIPNGPTTYNTALPTSSLNLAQSYNKVSIFFDYGLGDAGYAAMPNARTYYFDDVKYLP